MTHQPNPSFPPSINRPRRHRPGRVAFSLTVGLVGLVGVVGALVLSVAVTPEPQRPPELVVRDVDDTAVADRAGVETVTSVTNVTPDRPAYLIIQDEIDQRARGTRTSDARRRLTPPLTFAVVAFSGFTGGPRKMWTRSPARPRGRRQGSEAWSIGCWGSWRSAVTACRSISLAPTSKPTDGVRRRGRNSAGSHCGTCSTCV